MGDFMVGKLYRNIVKITERKWVNSMVEYLNPFHRRRRISTSM